MDIISLVYICKQKQNMNSNEIINYRKTGFDGDKYVDLQKNQILERISNFNGRLYLEIGGKFMTDPHASRVLPWFDPKSKKNIFSNLKDQAEVLFCVNADDIINNRQLANIEMDYAEYVERMIKNIEREIWLKPHIVINKINISQDFDKILEFERSFQKKNYRVWERYMIIWYPHNTETILSENGFGNDDHIPLTKNLILVTWAASNSGKMSTCLGQIYMDHQIDIKSGYAKYETFPIWNLPLEHPVNLAYEAATADIGDYNMLDEYHKKEYGRDAVNYNRDVEWFEIVMSVCKNIVNHKNYMRKYKSPTDMWISCAGFCVEDDEIISIASLQEVRRRKEWYQQVIDRNEWDQSWVTRCEELEAKCLDYCKNKWYDIDIKLD